MYASQLCTLYVYVCYTCCVAYHKLHIYSQGDLLDRGCLVMVLRRVDWSDCSQVSIHFVRKMWT